MRILVVLSMIVFGCMQEASQPVLEPLASVEHLAEVQSVVVAGPELKYTFEVQVVSPDTGCDQYADWWEVMTLDGLLVYRRILTHSHTGEQPFVRSGGPIDVSADQPLIVRVHMNSTGYSIFAMKGSVKDGFESIELEEGFEPLLADQWPFPPRCTF